MRLVRYGAIGQEKPGLIDKSGQLRDLSDHVKDLSGEAYAPAALAKLTALDPAKLPAVSGKPRIGAPVTGKSKSPPSSAPAPSTYPRPTRSTTSPATASVTTYPSAISRSSVWVNGPRASRTTPSVRSDPGWPPRTRYRTCRNYRCGSM